MPITELLEKNAKLYSDEVCLVEINPELAQKREWKEFDLVEPDTRAPQFRFEITWKEFDNRANRFANTLIKSGVKKGDKVAILLMNCLEWLPIYFGILKTGALAVPLNFRFTGDEIKYCLNLSEADLLIFGPEFTERVEPIYKDLPRIKSFIFLDDDYKNASNLELISMVTPDMLESSAPDFASDYAEMVAKASADAPGVKLTDDDDAAI